MGRTKGALNRQNKLPTAYTLSNEDRLKLIANLLIEIISEELCTNN